MVTLQLLVVFEVSRLSSCRFAVDFLRYTVARSNSMASLVASCIDGKSDRSCADAARFGGVAANVGNSDWIVGIDFDRVVAAVVFPFCFGVCWMLAFFKMSITNLLTSFRDTQLNPAHEFLILSRCSLRTVCGLVFANLRS